MTKVDIYYTGLTRALSKLSIFFWFTLNWVLIGHLRIRQRFIRIVRHSFFLISMLRICSKPVSLISQWMSHYTFYFLRSGLPNFDSAIEGLIRANDILRIPLLVKMFSLSFAKRLVRQASMDTKKNTSSETYTVSNKARTVFLPPHNMKHLNTLLAQSKRETYQVW